VFCPLDVGILPLLRSAGQQDHELFTVATEIEPVSRSPIDAKLLHPCPDAFDVREIPMSQTLDRDSDFRRRLTIKIVEPRLKGAWPSSCS
jgi:hypothetical protein